MKFAFTVVLVLFTLLPLYGQAPSRVQGVVTNSKGEPLEGVKIAVTDEKVTINTKELKTDKKGRYQLAVTDGTHTYLFLLEKEGYVSWKESVKPQIFKTMEKNFVLKTQKDVAEENREKMMKDNPHIALFEEGKDALIDGNLDLAEQKLKASIAKKDDYYQSHLLLSNVYFKKEEYKDAVKEAQKALDIKGEDILSAYKLLAICYTKMGEAEKAKAAQAKVDEMEPDNPQTLYNRAADLINQQKDKEAIEKLEQLISVDPSFARAYFELGFCYLRTGDMAKAKANLKTYLEKAPKGEKVKEAKEALKWL